MQPLFIPGSTGPLFAVYYPPVAVASTQAILHVPAFAEEMNKSRRMVALQARAFAEQGYAVLVLDLFGTGDSAGDFGQATWAIWRQDVKAALAWLLGQGAQTLTLWGLRLGVLLALDAAAGFSEYPVDRLLAWQPVTQGETFITQFLRLRVAAAMLNSTVPKESVAALKQRLMAGEAVEVAGYCLNPELVNPLIALRTDHMRLPNLADTALFEVSFDATAPLSAGSVHWLAHLQKNGQANTATGHQVLGPSFWSSQEIAEAPALIVATSKRIAEGRAVFSAAGQDNHAISK